jgi:hypothetical protein
MLGCQPTNFMERRLIFLTFFCLLALPGFSQNTKSDLYKLGMEKLDELHKQRYAELEKSPRFTEIRAVSLMLKETSSKKHLYLAIDDYHLIRNEKIITHYL